VRPTARFHDVGAIIFIGTAKAASRPSTVPRARPKAKALTAPSPASANELDEVWLNDHGSGDHWNRHPMKAFIGYSLHHSVEHRLVKSAWIARIQREFAHVTQRRDDNPQRIAEEPLF
jgi:hypothetical protein